MKKLVFCLFVIFSISIFAQNVPNLIDYQGTLADENSVAVNGPVSITFTIYDDETGSNALWTETQNPVYVSNGLFHVFLGAVNTLPDSIFYDDERWVGVNVNNDGEMTPHNRIGSVPYAINAGGSVPVGSIVAWHKDFDNTPSLSEGWVECNGQLLNDTESIYNGQTIPDLNGNISTQRFLRGNTASGQTGGSEIHSHMWLDTGSARGIEASTVRELSSFDSNGNEEEFNNESQIDGEPYYTDKQGTLPSYFEIVWIMRVK